MKFISTKRPIIECAIGGKPAAFLLDTGAGVGFIDREFINEYALTKGKRYRGTIIGAGGTLGAVHYCDSVVDMPNGREATQFLLADISNVRESIQVETGIEIVGIISWPQMTFCGITLKEFDHARS